MQSPFICMFCTWSAVFSLTSKINTFIWVYNVIEYHYGSEDGALGRYILLIYYKYAHAIMNGQWWIRSFYYYKLVTRGQSDMLNIGYHWFILMYVSASGYFISDTLYGAGAHHRSPRPFTLDICLVRAKHALTLELFDTVESRAQPPLALVLLYYSRL